MKHLLASSIIFVRSFLLVGRDGIECLRDHDTDHPDREIGRIIAQLKEMKSLGNTVLFFASDNGASAEIMVHGGHDPASVVKPKEWNGETIPEAPGHSLVPAFAEDVRIPRPSLWWLHEGHRAVLVGDWKLVADKGRPWEHYDMRTDRAEQFDLNAKMPEKVEELKQVWHEWRVV